jgi:uncharacterized protein (TIGR02231 family)
MRHSKSFFLSFSLFFVLCSASSAEILKPNSQITTVTIYPDSVLVTRQARVNLSSGEHSIALENIIPEIDEGTLTVAGSGQADVKLYGGHIKREYLTDSSNPRIKELTDQIQNIWDQVNLSNSEINNLNQEKAFVDSVRLYAADEIPKELVTKMPTSLELDGTLEFISSQLNNIEKKRLDINNRIRDLNKEREVLERELNDLRGPNYLQKRSIVVDLSCQKAGDFDLSVSYLVYGATWHAIYDARAELAKNQVELTAFGVIQQTTGEDWENVDLTLSTSKPSIGGRLPYIAPWIIRPQSPMQHLRASAVGAAMPMAKEVMMDSGVQYEAYYMEAFDKGDAVAEKKAQMAYSDVQSKGVSMTYKLPRKVSVKSDGAEQKVPIFSQTFQADFEYASYPRVSPYAYLGSRVKNTSDAQLLAGNMNVFLEGDFVGSSSIDFIGPGEEFDLYLGINENIKIERKEISKKVDDVMLGGIPSPNRTTTFKYKLSAENYTGERIKLSLYEAMPVSENDRIKIKVDHVSIQPQDKDWKDRKGIWRWEFSLDPRAKQEAEYTFSVEHPKDMPIEGL